MTLALLLKAERAQVLMAGEPDARWQAALPPLCNAAAQHQDSIWEASPRQSRMRARLSLPYVQLASTSHLGHLC
jgi:hypothetical protein